MNNIPRKISNILEALKLEAQVEDFPPEQDRIHLANGTLLLDGTFTEGRPEIVRSRLPVAYRPDAPKPARWLAFLDELLYPEDIPTLQEFIGYCLIPSNKGQRMMVIKGKGGEGKSQIGAVLGSIFGSNMKDGSIGKISENRFSRADLEHVLLCVDDDIRMEALRQTNYVKSIVTAQGKMDLERKGKQSYQGWMFARLLAFSNGDLQALFDRSDGFYRRQLIWTHWKLRPKGFGLFFLQSLQEVKKHWNTNGPTTVASTTWKFNDGGTLPMVKNQEQIIDKCEIPVWRKYTLSVQEAAKYFHIGDKKLRKLIDENPSADFILWNGTRPQIKRRVFERFVDEKLSAI